MLNRQNLPLNGLRAFEAAARHQSFSAAAEELCVTHGAISQQIKALEERTGLRLFDRHNRGVQLTDAGASLLPILSESFDKISITLDALTQSRTAGRLTVTTTPYFATRWLLPRLSQWRDAHPALSARLPVDLLPSLAMLDLPRSDADVGIRCGVPPWPGLVDEFLLPIHLAPLCSPAFLASAPSLSTPRDLANHTLIHADVEGHQRGEEWNLWLDSVGVASQGQGFGLHFHDPALALQAAADGLGVAIGYLEFVQDDVASGRLVQPFDLTVRHAFSYHLVFPERLADDQDAQAFIEWLRQESS